MKTKLAVLVALVFGGVTFEPRTFQIRASKNVAATTVTVSFQVPVADAQRLVDEAKKNGAVVTKSEADDYSATMTYVVKPSSGTSVGGFTF